MKVLSTPAEVLGAFTSGKAFNLARLAHEFPVPAFVVIMPAKDGSIAPQKSVDTLVQDWKRVAVRSSADVEDSGYASFAGMFETELGVSQANLWESVARVARSATLARVADYANSQRIRYDQIQVSVIVQRMVQADRSGVAFSRSSVGDSRTVIEAVFGLGEGLVSGRYTPDRYFCTAGDGVIAVDAVAYQKHRLIYAQGIPGTVEEVVEPTRRNSQKLTSDEIAQVTRLANRVEASTGFASADIEWSFERGQLFLLQARPYTAYTT